MKQLSSFIEVTQSHKPFKPCTLKFYLRDANSKTDGIFRLVEISLREPNIRSTILSILKTCNLSTDYVNSVSSASESSQETSMPVYDYQQEYDIYTIIKVKRKIKKVKEAITLR